MADANIVVYEPIIADGHLHRVYVEGDKRGTKNGAYILHLDGKPAGWAHHFRTGATITWSVNGNRQRMTKAMRRQIDEERLRQQQEREMRQAKVALRARYIWRRVIPLQLRTHPYLIRKHIDSFGLKIDRHGVLIVPIYNIDNALVNLQFIDADGNKRFLAGGRKAGCFSTIGTYRQGDPLIVCEGWATGASIHQDCGHFVVVAMDAGNLEPVARAFRMLNANADIIIAGDNDVSGVGQSAARKAALAVGGRYMIPPTIGNDWNDELSVKAVSRA
ncbi:toprim domain-containing protein [Methylomonas koyamae]|nr:toprim domain-containing protein [Methylomonas koyamae]